MTTEPQNTPGAKTKGTPLPWEVHEVEDAGEVISRGFRQVGGMGINTGEDVELFSKADAEFIVRACNSHDALVAALKESQTVLGMLVRPETDGANVPLHIAWAQCLAAESKCRAALALATSEVQS